MNSNLTLGVLVFILWSSFSSWYYVCKIKGLCLDNISIATEDDFVPEPIGENEIDNTTKELDTLSIENPEPVLAPINRIEDKIYFEKNSSEFVDIAYVQQLIDELKSIIEEREINIKIVGATCDLGTKEHNLELGQRRAEIMRKFLEDNNVQPINFETFSVGERDAQPGNEEQIKYYRKVTLTIKSINP